MLKNSVPIDEYVLMTEPVYRQSAPPIRESVIELEYELEGLGLTKLYYCDLQPIALECPRHQRRPCSGEHASPRASCVTASPRSLRKQPPHTAAAAAAQ